MVELLQSGAYDAALALGATKWETTLIVLENASSGIAGAVVLGLGRALGDEAYEFNSLEFRNTNSFSNKV